jgi:glycosyltransferase involved in cell wall biosynthesis
MKVLMTADTLGGVWTFALELARALAPRGVRTALATLGAPLSPRQWDEAKGVPGLDVHEGRWKLEWMDDPWADVEASGRWLLDVERRVRPDVVHLNGTMSHAALPWRAPVVVTGHSCVLSWWHGARGHGAPPEFDRYRDEVARGLRAADLVTAPTAAMLGALAAHYGGPLPRTRVVPNGRDPRRFPFADRKEPLVLSAGRLWDEAKNIGALAAAAPGLRDGWTACVAGDDRHPDNGGVAFHPNLRLLGPARRRRPGLLDAACAIYAPPRPLRAFRPVGPRSRVRRLRPGARRHPEPARDLARAPPSSSRRTTPTPSERR